MMSPVAEDAGWLGQGRDLQRRGAGAQPRQVFGAALVQVAGTPEEGAAAEGVAAAAWELEEGEEVVAYRERAYRCYRAEGDDRGAGRVASWLGLDAIHFRSEVAVAQGWFQRAHRLLDDLAEGAEHGVLALLEGMVALRVGRDTLVALDRADVAIGVGRRMRSPDLEIQALALRGLALVGQGQVGEGMRLLDEASAAALAGEVEDLGSVWIPCCFLMWGCEQVRDWDRAGQWCDRVRQFCEDAHWLGSPYSLCRSHYGAVLLWRGEWAAAESELRQAGDALARQRPWFAADALARLGELRRRQGHGPDAEVIFARARPSLAARIGLAELNLDHGRPAAAVDIVERSLDLLAPDARMERAAALEVGIRAAARAGQADRWVWAVEELGYIAELVGTDAVTGSALWAAGVHVGVGDAKAAIGLLERAVERFDRAGGRYDAARARVDLASAFLGAGRPTMAVEEATMAFDTLIALGAHPDAQRAARVRAQAGGDESVADGLTARQREILALVTSGLSNREIAERLVLSEHTVKRHVANILTRLGLRTRAAAAAHASRSGLA
ncbi:MAG: hypothetical protein NVSMB12_22210 [Acidimicrobiales bacterium]